MLMLTVLYSLFSGSENAHMLPKQYHGQAIKYGNARFKKFRIFFTFCKYSVCRNVRANAANVRTAEEENKTTEVCAKVEV